MDCTAAHSHGRNNRICHGIEWSDFYGLLVKRSMSIGVSYNHQDEKWWMEVNLFFLQLFITQNKRELFCNILMRIHCTVKHKFAEYLLLVNTSGITLSIFGIIKVSFFYVFILFELLVSGNTISDFFTM